MDFLVYDGVLAKLLGIDYPDKPLNRGTLLTEETLNKIGEWGRYKDSGHNAKGRYSERPDEYVDNMDRLACKFETARECVSKPEIDMVSDAAVGLLGYGTSHWAIQESRDQFREETYLKTSYLRVRAYPFSQELAKFIDAHDSNHCHRAESGRSACAADAGGADSRAQREASQRAALQRPAARCQDHHRRRARAGGP